MSQRTKIYVGNISDSCKADDLRSLFSKFGKVDECDVVKNFGFVHMGDEDESKVAIEALNGSEFMGVKITVEASHSKVRPKPGMGGKGQCYRCGKSGHWSKECPRNSYERAPYESRGGPPGRSGPPGYDPPSSYGGRSSYGPVRGYPPMERGYERGGSYGRPYPDPYDRRPVGPPRDEYPSRRAPYDDGYYSRRPAYYADEYYGRRSPPPPPRERYSYDRAYYEDRSAYGSYSGHPGPSRREPIY